MPLDTVGARPGETNRHRPSLYSLRPEKSNDQPLPGVVVSVAYFSRTVTFPLDTSPDCTKDLPVSGTGGAS
jgi:hypothetical protein